MRLRNDITAQFHEIVIAIVGEEILGLNGHQPGDEGKEGHFCVFMQQLFRSFEKLEECLNLHCRRILSNLCLYSFKHLFHPISTPHSLARNHSYTSVWQWLSCPPSTSYSGICYMGTTQSLTMGNNGLKKMWPCPSTHLSSPPLSQPLYIQLWSSPISEVAH
jgi:hypothetical protein